MARDFDMDRHAGRAGEADGPAAGRAGEFGLGAGGGFSERGCGENLVY
jgi:hypothetical protein